MIFNNFKKNIVFMMLMMISLNSFSQSKRVWLYKADYNFEKYDYASALKLYFMVLDDSLGLSMQIMPYEVELSNQKLIDKKDSIPTVSTEDYATHQIAVCYRNSYDYERALQYFKQTTEAGSYPDDGYYYANSLMNLGKYDESLEAYDKFFSVEGTSDEIVERALQDMTACSYAKTLKSNTDIINVELLDTAVFNKGTTAFGVSFWGDDKLIFSSARKGGVVVDPEVQDSEYLLDLYWTERDGDNWNEAKNFGRPLNSAKHDASGMFNNHNVIFSTHWSSDKLDEKYITVTRGVGDQFFETQKLDFNVNIDGFQSINPFVSEDGKWLFFSSNKPGTVGGLDLWKIKIDKNGNTIGESINLGKPVNTEFDEKAPFYHETLKVLFFSSNGHNNLGGFDIFKSKYDNDLEMYRSPNNLGAPINSSKDDTYFILDSQLKNGFLTSNRGDCSNCDSIYKLCASCDYIYSVTYPNLEFSISGYVYDETTGEVIPEARVKFTDVTFVQAAFELTTDANGFYSQSLGQNQEIFLKASKKGYFADAAIASTAGEVESKTYKQDFYLETIPTGEIVIEGIEYDFDRATLRPESKLILDKVIEFLELNDDISIEIRSHTDQRGSADYNLSLSERRAKSVYDYIIVNGGVGKDRLISKGYGETTPVEALNAEGEIVVYSMDYINSLKTKKAKDEAYQKNRRTAFKVINQK
jgi:OOP family OmpA-OmpF porin